MPRAKIIAEISGNHAGRRDYAFALVDAAKASGADLVKFQAFTVDEMCPVSEDPAYTLTDGPWAGRPLRSLYERTQTPLEWLPDLFQYARELQLEPFASVFGETSLQVVAALRPAYWKVASAEAMDRGFVERVMSYGPTFVSMGCVESVPLGAIPMWCVAEYPAGSAHLPSRPGDRWGFSDHTTGMLAAQLAVARGAGWLEKHLMLDGVPCEDAGFSLTPSQFAAYVRGIREAELHFRPRIGTPEGFVRRWVAARDLAPGPLQGGDLRTARAHRGMLPVRPLTTLRVAKRAGEPIEIGDAW